MSVFKNRDNIKIDLRSSEDTRTLRQRQEYSGIKKLKSSVGKIKIGL